jgi:hypothetical protein
MLADAAQAERGALPTRVAATVDASKLCAHDLIAAFRAENRLPAVARRAHLPGIYVEMRRFRVELDVLGDARVGLLLHPGVDVLL